TIANLKLKVDGVMGTFAQIRRDLNEENRWRLEKLKEQESQTERKLHSFQTDMYYQLFGMIQRLSESSETLTESFLESNIESLEREINDVISDISQKTHLETNELLSSRARRHSFMKCQDVHDPKLTTDPP